MTKIKPHEKFEGIYWAILEDESERLATVNLAPGAKVYGERLISEEEVEYRIWDPFRSKLAAIILKGAQNIPIKPNSKILYLGAGSGTTCSHVSDIVGKNGVVYCVEFAPRVVRDLVTVCEQRPNMIPILADATNPNQYKYLVEEVDVIYQDVAQPVQAGILVKNAEFFLRKNGFCMLMIKARSIDVTKEPSQVFKSEISTLEQKFSIIEVRHLEPFEKDHAGVVGKLTK
ncbi:MAG: fibrillarin-like rRNA/tRNA 2'-O-methyltransferase [Euryarchaeota archaeon]|nr:fibrillarin-like rRNA/tRNA 2'-O-methyltransferase [Euryarchaeota archaeon]